MPVFQRVKQSRRQKQLAVPAFIGQIPVIHYGKKLIRIWYMLNGKAHHLQSFLHFTAGADSLHHCSPMICVQPDFTAVTRFGELCGSVKNNVKFLFAEPHCHTCLHLPAVCCQQVAGDDRLPESHQRFGSASDHEQQADAQKHKIVCQPEHSHNAAGSSTLHKVQDSCQQSRSIQNGQHKKRKNIPPGEVCPPVPVFVRDFEGLQGNPQQFLQNGAGQKRTQDRLIDICPGVLRLESVMASSKTYCISRYGTQKQSMGPMVLSTNGM